jgi:hypothetical protein
MLLTPYLEALKSLEVGADHPCTGLTAHHRDTGGMTRNHCDSVEHLRDATVR